MERIILAPGEQESFCLLLENGGQLETPLCIRSNVRPKEFQTFYVWDKSLLEITDVNRHYLELRQLDIVTFEKEVQWFDAGDAESLFQASAAIRALQYESKYVVYVEEQAYKNEYISLEQLQCIGEQLRATNYGQYLIHKYKNLEK